ncbi:hypothetical protein FHG87_007736 [Trinorchestia longiramus]|nr:hypothetical protein FHG87_007736 [Trinorchestia longiramus]
MPYRSLMRSGVVDSLMRDVGRQRVTHFVVRDLVESSPFTQEFTQEKQKLMKLLHKTTSMECKENASSQCDPLDESSSTTPYSTAVPDSVVENEVPSSRGKNKKTKGRGKRSKESTHVAISSQESSTSSEMNVTLPIQLDSSARVVALDDDDNTKTAASVRCGDENDQITDDSHVGATPVNKQSAHKSSDSAGPVKSRSSSSAPTPSTSAQSTGGDAPVTGVEETGVRRDAIAIITGIASPTSLETIQEAAAPQIFSDRQVEIGEQLGPSSKLKSEEGNNLIQLKQELCSPVRISNVGRIFDKSKGEYVSDGNLQEAMLSMLNETEGVDVSMQYDEPMDEGPDVEEEFASDDGDLPRVSSIIEDSSLAASEHPDVRYKKFLDGSNLVSPQSKRLSPNLTARLLKRANVILDMVRAKRVVTDVFQLQKAILEVEAEEEHRVDKKSVNRLVQRLRAGGLIKTVRVKFTTKSGSKENILVVDPSIKPDDSYLASVIEQLKVKHIPPVAKKDVHKKQPTDDNASVQANASLGPQAEVASMKYFKVKKHGPVKKNSLSQPGPKFVRLQELHHSLFYCARHYEGDAELNQEAAWNSLCREYPEAKLTSDPLPRLYLPEISWKMFIPPMPAHVKATQGWVLLSDVIMSLPLHVFTRIVRCASSPELTEWLQHPIKRFYLVKMLPVSLRSEVFEGRRYVYNIIQLVHRLCYMGLTQMGPQVCTTNKDRDQQFVFVNTLTTLMDTSTSGPGYHQISQDRSYSFSYYTFQDLREVSQYWQDLRTTCLSTPLGGHRGVAGQDITIHMLSHKPQMEASIAITQFREAPQRDCGEVPGDKKGAAGLDSAMFAHIKRNWNFRKFTFAASHAPSQYDTVRSLCGEALLQSRNVAPSSQVHSVSLYRSYLLSTTQAPPVSSSSRLPGLRKLASYKSRKGEERSVEVGLQVMSREEKKLQKPKPVDEQKKKEVNVVKRTKKNKVTMRRIKVRQTAPKKPYYDEEDRAALRRMNKLRVDWSSAEDSLLLLCKVASCYLLPVSIRPRMLPFSLVRSVLHKHCPESLNKTGRACQRRINYILKDPTTEDSVAIYVEEVKQDQYINKNFIPPGITRNRENLESIYGALFVQLVDYLVMKFSSKTSRKVLNLPNSIDEFYCDFMVVPMKGIKSAPHYFEPESTTDVQIHAIRSLLMSSLCCRADRESYAYQLYQAYGHYSHQTLYNTLVNLRNSQMISYKKSYNRSFSNNQTCLPLSASPFQLSLAFTQKFINRYNYDLFGQCWQFMKRLRKSYHKAYVSEKPPDDLVQDSEYAVPLTREKKNEGGNVAALLELASLKRLIMHTCLPETIIVIDTKRTITNQLPFQAGSVSRRVADLAKARSKPKGVDDILGIDEDHPDDRITDCRPGLKRARSDSVCAEDNEQKKQKLGDFATDKLNKFDDGSNICIGEAEEDPTSDTGSELIEAFPSNQQTDFDDNFDTNDESVDELNSSMECHADDSKNAFRSKKNDPLKRSSQDHLLSSESSEACKKRRLDEEDSPVMCEDQASCSATDPYAGTSTLFDKNMEIDSNQAVSSDCKTGVNKWPLSSASRLSVFMKDQNTISSLENQALACGGPALLQHMQDNLLLTACDVMCLLTPSFTSCTNPPPTDDDLAVWEYIDSSVLPVDRLHLKRVLRKYSRGVLDTTVTLEGVLEEWQQGGCSEIMLSQVRQIYEFIHARGVLGATRQNIKEWRASCGEGDCLAVVVAMEETGLLVREGVVRATWLTLPNAAQWLIHTQYISRQDRQGVRLQGVYSVEVEPSLLKETESEGSIVRASDSQAFQPSHLTSSDGLITSEVDSSSSTPVAITDLFTGFTTEGTPETCSTGSSLSSESCTITAQGEESTSARESERAEDFKIADTNIGVCTRKRSYSARGGAKTGFAVEDVASKHEEASSGLITSPEEDHISRTRVRSRFVATRKNYTKDEEKSQRMEKNVKDHQKSGQREQVLVSVRPWVRVCGTLARRVLDRMLGSVLFAVLEKPGASGTNVAHTLAPSMPPAHVHELLHLLADIGCVRRTCVLMQQEHHSLFSKQPPCEFKDDVEDEVEETDVSYTPTVDCITKLSAFIGDKKYNMDFISSDRK